MSILALTSDTLTSPAAAGQIEYTSPIFAATPIGTQRGIVPTQQYYRLDSAVVGSNVATAQSIFGVGVTLSSSTVYAFEAVYALSKSAGTTSHSVGLGFGGTATINNIAYAGTLASNSSAFTADSTGAIGIYVQTAANTTFSNGASAAATIARTYTIKGTISVNVGGTFIPQYTLSAAPGGAYSTAIGSYIRIAPVGASGSNTSVGAWA